jgi:hypothetical protein
MQTNPYLPSRTESEQTRQESKGSVVVKILAAGSVLICVLLALLMAWARLLWWKNAGVPAGGNSFPYQAFAQQMTQVAAVGCSGIFAMWLAYWSVRRGRSR